ncbi:YitT family protein [Anianabacter salinae]|uniref:YitT family protein n=1 Tax=Anianabacter salinae TaxID=2851023 RepID=UPI00225DFDA7|nr:YitT family protein [Anianabacter salinae]MBV0912106.1 YitT family protein [Anianabacter salinae]
MLILDTPPADRHTRWEDVQGILIGTALVALSIQILSHPGLITGQIAGLALIAAYLTPLSFGIAFLALNMPFYILAVQRMGWTFTVKSFASVCLMSGFVELMPMVLAIERLNPAVAAILFGITAGVGLLSLFRHGASLGGIGILALYLQDKAGFPAGLTQLIFDGCLFLVAFLLFPAEIVLYSLLGAVVLNLIIAINHRRDRYIAK